jgi:hypothetical protein
MPETDLSPEQLNHIIEAYCNRVVDEMDTKSMEQVLYDLFVASFSEYTETEIKDTIATIYGDDYYNELVEHATQ